MIVKFKARWISRGARKLTWTPILIIIKIIIIKINNDTKIIHCNK
jgi:hypothetical protein